MAFVFQGGETDSLRQIGLLSLEVEREFQRLKRCGVRNRGVECFEVVLTFSVSDFWECL